MIWWCKYFKNFHQLFFTNIFNEWTKENNKKSLLFFSTTHFKWWKKIESFYVYGEDWKLGKFSLFFVSLHLIYFWFEHFHLPSFDFSYEMCKQLPLLFHIDLKKWKKMKKKTDMNVECWMLLMRWKYTFKALKKC